MHELHSRVMVPDQCLSLKLRKKAFRLSRTSAWRMVASAFLGLAVAVCNLCRQVSLMEASMTQIALTMSQAAYLSSLP